jgi:hypothetical protein
MNGLLWIAQLVLAGVFLFTGSTKLFVYEKLVKTLESRSKSGRIGMSRGQAAMIGLLEIAGGVGILTPADIVSAGLQSHLFILLAAGGLALLMVAAGIYHLRRQESAAPAVSLFLLAVFVVFGRWPR